MEEPQPSRRPPPPRELRPLVDTSRHGLRPLEVWDTAPQAIPPAPRARHAVVERRRWSAAGAAASGTGAEDEPNNSKRLEPVAMEVGDMDAVPSVCAVSRDAAVAAFVTRSDLPGVVRFWDMKERKTTAHTRVATRTVTAVAMAASTRRILVGCADGHVVALNAPPASEPNARAVQCGGSAGKAVNVVEFCPWDEDVWVGGGDAGEVVGVVGGAVHAMSVSPSSSSSSSSLSPVTAAAFASRNVVVVATLDGLVVSWNFVDDA